MYLSKKLVKQMKHNNSGADGNLTKASEQLLLSQTSRLRSRNAEGVGKKLHMDL